MLDSDVVRHGLAGDYGGPARVRAGAFDGEVDVEEQEGAEIWRLGRVEWDWWGFEPTALQWWSDLAAVSHEFAGGGGGRRWRRLQY